jgi:hypothetical protein
VRVRSQSVQRRSALPRGVRAAVLSLDDLVPPPIDGDLRSLFEEAGTSAHAALAPRARR